MIYCNVLYKIDIKNDDGGLIYDRMQGRKNRKIYRIIKKI